MTIITGQLKDSGNQALDGRLTVSLDHPMVDDSVAAGGLLIEKPRVFTITGGVVNISIPESQTKNITYRFVLDELVQQEVFYFEDGSISTGDHVLHTDNKWYTGLVKTATSRFVFRSLEPVPKVYMDFHAIVPNVASVKITDLLPTGITTDWLDSSLWRLAQILTSVPQYAEILRKGIEWKGDYAAGTFYSLNQAIAYDGSSWIYVNPSSKAGSTPGLLNTDWKQLAAKGGAGTGTLGNNTPYDATGWDNQTDAPSRNAVRDIIEQIRTANVDLTPLARLDGASFTGNVFVPNLAAIPANNQALNLGSADARYGELATANSWSGANTFSGSTTFSARIDCPNVAAGANDTRAANTAFVAAATAGVAKREIQYRGNRQGMSDQTLASGAGGADGLNGLIIRYTGSTNLSGQMNDATGFFTPIVSGLYEVVVSLDARISTASQDWLLQLITSGGVVEKYLMGNILYEQALYLIGSATCLLTMAAGTAYGIRLGRQTSVSGTGYTRAMTVRSFATNSIDIFKLF